MAEYYLISQLPSLDGLAENANLPITHDRFLQLCEQLLNKKALAEMAKITLNPPRDGEKTASAVVSQWLENERMLRLALGKLRADKMNKPFDCELQAFPAAVQQAARTAIEIENPMDAEKFLNRRRLDFLESLRPTDAFSQEFVFYFSLKLRLLERIRQFDTRTGENAYRTIYNSIIHGERTEVLQ
ncbi:MAG: DUF2764 family protein [Ruminococcaceae bacterium]|nr:DUF2764 family protein [Oscillospiraceae bacterium]